MSAHPARLAFLPGLLSLVAQTLLARELLVLFHGTELMLGAVLAAWLLAAGFGSWAAGRFLAGRDVAPAGALAATALVAAAAFPCSVLVARGAAAWLPVPAGTLPGLRLSALFSVALVAGTATPCGAWYAFASAGGGAAGPGRAYAWEAAGGFAGGLLLVAGLAGRVDGYVAAALAGALVLAGTAWRAAAGGGGSARGRIAAAGLVACALALVASDPALDLARRSQAARWPRFELVDARDSRYGNLALVRGGGQLTLFSSGSPAFSFPDPENAETAAHLPLLAAARVERVLVAGGGVGGVLGEVLRHPVREVDYVELDPAVVDLVRPALPAPLAAALADPRVSVRHADLVAWLASRPDRYDVVLLGAPEPATAAANRFFTREFFALARRALRPGGLLSLGLSSSPNYLGPELRLRNGSVWRALGAAFPRVEVLSADPLLLLASAGPGPLADPVLLADRLAARGIRTRTLGPEVIRSLLDPGRAAFTAGELEGADAPANTDASPVAYLYHSRYRAALDDPAAARWLPAFRGGGRWLALALPAALLAFGAALPRLGAAARQAALGAAAATVGCCALSLQYLLLFVYQMSRGTLYGALGALSGAFMAGMAAGSLAAVRRLEGGAEPAGRLRAGMLRLAAAPAAAALGFAAILALGRSAAPWAADAAALSLAAGCGAVAGFPFPFLVPAHGAGVRPAALAGRFYALDLLGSAAGALLTSLWLLPLLGLWWSLAFQAALAASALFALRKQ